MTARQKLQVEAPCPKCTCDYTYNAAGHSLTLTISLWLLDSESSYPLPCLLPHDTWTTYPFPSRGIQACFEGRGGIWKCYGPGKLHPGHIKCVHWCVLQLTTIQITTTSCWVLEYGNTHMMPQHEHLRISSNLWHKISTNLGAIMHWHEHECRCVSSHSRYESLHFSLLPVIQ